MTCPTCQHPIGPFCPVAGCREHRIERAAQAAYDYQTTPMSARWKGLRESERAYWRGLADEALHAAGDGETAPATQSPPHVPD